MGTSSERHRSRPQWHKWYGLARWQRRRDLQLKQQPLCEICKLSGFFIEATVANHKVPHKGDERAFWEGELNSVCRDCHNSRIQQTEKHGFTREIGASGWPIDDRHPVYEAERKRRKANEDEDDEDDEGDRC